MTLLDANVLSTITGGTTSRNSLRTQLAALTSTLSDAAVAQRSSTNQLTTLAMVAALSRR